MSRDILNACADYLLTPQLAENRARFDLFAKILGVVIVLNVLDGLLTLFWVYTDRATEMNPLMSVLIEAHPVLFMSLKIALVHLGSIILLRNCDRSLAKLSVLIAFSLYGALILYHSSMVFITIG